MNVEIEVTAEHISDGEKASCYTCPVALALKDHLPENQYARVDENTIIFYSVAPHSILKNIRTPDEVVGFIMDFDKYVDVKPFSFAIELP